MSKGRKINISVEEAFGIPDQKKGPDTINPTTDPLKKSQGGPISEGLSPESLRILEETRGAKAGGAAIDKGSELFRLQGGTFSVDEAINYNANLAANQSFGEQVGNVTKNAIPTFAAGFLDNFNYDIPDMVGLVNGQEKEYGNWLTDITQSLRKAGDAPVYQEGDSLADPTYWAKQAQNFSYTAGLITGTLVEQAAMTALSVESLGAAAPMQALSLGNKAKLFKNAAFGTWKGVQEGYINALETFEGTKKKYEGLGYSQEEAIKYASEAASIGYKMETGPLMVLNALQFGAIGKLNPFGKSAGVNTGFGGAVESALSPAFSRIAYKPLSKLVAGGVNIGSESVEEIIQTGVGRYAEHRQLSKTKDTFTDFEFWNNEMRDSAIGGAFGGGVFTVAGSVSDKIQDKKTGAVQGRIYDNFITNNKKRTEQHTIELAQAIQEGDVEKQRNIEFKMQRESVFEALKLDYTLKKETAFDSHIKTLEGALEAIQNKDVEALKKYGLLDEASIKNALQSFPRLIAQSNKIKDTFLKNYEKSEDFTVAATLTDSQMVSENSIRYIEENKKSIEEFKRKNFSGLSPQGQVHMNNLLRKEEIMIQAGINSITAAERTELESLEEMINTGDEGLSALDKNLFKTLDASEILNTYVENENLKKVQETATERIEEWSKPGKAKEVKVNEAVQEIKKAKSKESLVEVKEALEKENALTPKVEQVINAKIVEAEVNATVPPQEEGENFAEIEREAGPPTSPVREETAQEINAIFEQLEAEYTETDNFTKLSDDQLFEPVDVSDMSDGLRSKMQKAVGQYYENLRTEKDNPSFSDFIQDFIKHNAKDSTDRIFNALVEGWKANGLQEADYAQVYSNIFKNRKDIAFDILGIANEIIGEAPTVAEVASETKKVLEEVKKEAAPTVALNTNNEPVLKDTTPFRTSQATLKAAHLSMPYNREFVTDEDGNVTVVDTDDSTELLTGNDVNSMKLLNPDLFNPGTVLSVSIPPNYMNMKVSVWEDDITKGKSITFGEWMAKNNVTKGSPEWIAKVPMVATDQDGEGVFMMHDTDWYNPVNVGLKDSPADQFGIIQEANLNLMNVRNKLQDVGQSFEITITVKRPGTWKLVDKNSPPITINQANPQTRFAIANKDGDLVIEANELLEKDDVNLLNTKKDFKDGHTYQIRRGVNKNEVIAFQVFRNKLSENAVSTVNGLVEAYLYQKDEGGSVSDFAKTKEVREQVLTATGLDVFNMRDFETLINMYIPTLRGKFGSPASVSIEVEKNSRIPNGTPYFVVQKGAFVFGVKGQEIVPGKKAYYIHPMKMKDEGGPAQMAFRLRKFTAMLPNATQNISKEGLSTDRNTVVIDKDKNVFPKESYREFLKNTLTTTVKSFNVGTKDKPVYATYVQPVINFEVTGESKVDVANPTPAKVEEIKVKMSEAQERAAFEQAQEAIERQVEEGQAAFIADEERNRREAEDVEMAALTKKEQAIVQSSPEKFETVEPLKIEDVTPPEATKSPEEIQNLKDSIEMLLQLGVSENAPELQILRDELGIEYLDEPTIITSEDIAKMKQDVTGVPGLTIIQDFQVTDYVFNEVSKRIDFKFGTKVDKNEILKDVKSSYFDLLGPKQKNNMTTIANLEKMVANSPGLAPVVERMKKEVKIYTTIRDNWKMIEKGGLDKVRKFTGIKETSDTMEVLNENGEVEKNYSKTSLEEGGKGTASYRLKRFLAGIKEVDANGTAKTGFLGVPTYVGFDVAYATIESVLSSPVEVDSSFQDMMVRLEENVKNHKWLRQVIEQLKSADEQIQNELVYNFTRHTLSMKFVMFSKNRDGSYSLKVYDTNSTEITRVIRTQWDSNLKNSPLVYAANGTHKINKDRAKFLLEQFEAFQSSIVPATAGNVATVGATNEQLKTWLEDFGIVLSEDTLNEMRTKQVTYMTKDGQATMNFTKLFKNSSNSDGVFGLLANYLQNIIEQDDTTLDENPQNHPFDNANNVLKTLAKIESKYSLNATTNSFRDGGKSIYGFTATKLATDLSKKLKATDSEYRAQLLEKSFNKHSHILKLLNSSESFRDKMQIDHLGITAMKELGKGTFGDNSLTGLSNSDHELTKLGLFQDREQGELREFFDEAKFIGLRMARMFFPTMSDKSQMLMLQTAVLDLNAKHFTIVDGVATIKEQIAEAMYSQMVRPELERLTSFAARNEPTNIKGYDMAARMFLMIPELNNMVDADTGLRVIALMNQQPSVYNMEWFEEKIRPQAKEIITKLVANDSAKKIKEWEVAGFIETKNGVKSTKFLNQKYFNNISASTVEEKIQVAANDFVINSLISNANIHMVFAGDIASYSQDKIKQYFEDGNPIAPVAALKDGTIVGDKAYAMVSRDIISVNLGKRLALLLAPGNKIANSKGDKYTQIFLNDFFDITSNVPTLVELFYGKEESVKAAKIVSDYNATKDGAARKRLAKQLAADYPQLEDYFDIESTDAQEYTTLSEHINVLWRQGRLHSTQYEAMKAKAESGQNLTYEELRLVFQPIKPVHTGFRDEPGMDMMRMMYIKSSSYPLIPQLTKGLELDKLRLMLEDQEKKTGKKVRASYQSANKVGANNKAISIYNPDGTYNTELSDLEISEASLVLDRDNFRIQQDVPFKSAKNSTDKVSLGTQTLKLLFGDGMLDIDDFEMDGVKMSGKELYDKFVNDYDGYINLKKASLFKQLGVDEKGQPIDVEKTMDNLQKMLKIEAEERGYPKQDIEALKIVPKLDKDGNIVDVQFSIPLWLSPNSNRYEALLNAIVTTRLVNVKLPGSAYVLGTEAGYKMQEDFSGIRQSNIVFTSKWQGELKAYEKGKLAQIFLPSKFRDNEGNLIDLMSDKYSYRDEDGMLRLREDMVDSTLLERTSFRIPTSAHVSMSQVVIAGFLPTEVGDLMILPKNFTKQKGIDFDVDKETTYHLHTYMDADGKMRAFDEDARQETLKKFDSQHNDDTAEAKLMREIFGDDVNFLDDEFEPGEKLDKINDKLKEKIFENELVKIHAAVLSNHNPAVQRKINKVLSMDFATKQAELIQKELKGDQDDTYFTMLSDSYHKSKVELGAAGKLGIGVYSNYVVFHSMIQQSSKPIQLKTRDGEGGLIPLKVTIGKQTSNGMLGGKNSLAQGVNKRSIAEVFAERQNTATDNEKEQIMGRVNVNEVTINVDSLLSALGFDKDTLDDGSAVSLPYLFLSQPIIRDFVEALRKTNSNTTEFSSAAREIVINELKQKYISETDYNAELVPQMMTGQTLFNNLNTPSNMIQLEVLEMFLGLDKYAKNIALLQGRMNITGSGLGKSFFETIDKHYALQNIIKDNEANKSGIIIGNASNLIGDYIKKDSIEPEHVGRDFASEGYVDLGSYWIKPNNPIGSMLVNSVDTGYNLWKDFFPFDDYFIKQVMDEIRKEVSSEDASSTKVIETQQNIFKEMKKFFVTSQLLEVINGDPGAERQRLFIDTEGKQSLPNYMNEVVRDTNILKSNKLLSRFQYTINKNGLPSLIKFDNTKGENFDEDYLYLSLIELMEAKEALPDFQGKPYDTEMLAKDLIAYNYLEGGIQEAVQFSKYISISYLNTIKFAGFTREWNGKFRPGVFNKILGIRQDDKPSVFTRQYVQNTPQKLTKVDPKTQIMDAAYTGDNKDLGNLVEFALNEKALTEVEQGAFAKVNFVTIYNSTTKKGLKKFQVYERSNDKFRRISTLGVFGMAEYSIGQESMGSVVNDSFRHASPPAKAIVKKVAQPKANNAIDFDNMSGKEIIATVANFDFVQHPHLKAVAQAIMPYLPDSLEFKTDDLVVNGVRVARGRYNVAQNLITIDKLYLATATSEDLAKTILHETIHALTAKYINQHIDIKTGEFLSENPPKEIVDLVLLFNETKRKLGPEIEAYGKKRQDQLAGRTTEGTTERERTVAYAGTNIKEFVTLVMTEPNFQKEMMDTIYKQSDKNLLEKLAEIVKNILHTVLGESFNKDGVTSQGILASMQIIESQYAGEIDIDTTAAEANRLMDLMVEQLAQGGPPAFNPDEFENKPPEVTFEPTDFIWRFNKKKNLNYVVEGNFPLSMNLVDKVKAGEQSITIRNPKYKNSEGIYNVDGTNLAISRVGNKPVTIGEMKAKGYTEADILKAFKGGTIADIKEQSVKDWFNGIGTKNIYFVKDVTNPSKSLNSKEADWLIDNLKTINNTYDNEKGNLFSNQDFTLKNPIIIGDTKVTEIVLDVGGNDSVLRFTRPTGDWSVKIEERNGKMLTSLYQYKEATDSYVSVRISEEKERGLYESTGILSLIESIYKDVNIPDPGNRLGRMEAANQVGIKYGIKRTYKDIYNEHNINKPEVLLEPSEYVIFDENQVSIVLHADEMHFIKTKDGKFYMTSESQDLRQITKETFDLASNDPAFDTFGILDKEERLSFIGGLNSLTRSMYQGELGTPLFRIPFKCN